LETAQIKKKPRKPLTLIRKNATPPVPWAKSDSEKVELFANHIAKVFTPHDNTLDPEVKRELVTHIPNIRKNLPAFTLSELKQVIKQLNPHKAPGFDLIAAYMLQKMLPEGLQTLLYIFSAMTKLEYWPVPLKHTKIIMIPKPGKIPLMSHHIDQSVSCP
jgi:hypothetical protein